MADTEEQSGSSTKTLKVAIGLAGCLAPLGPLIVLLIAFMVLAAVFSGGDIVPTGSTGGGGGSLADCSVTAEQIDRILTEKYASQGYNLAPHSNQIHHAACDLFHVNPLLSLAIMHHDSSFGTAGAGETCKNPGNIGYADYSEAGVQNTRCTISRWAAFSTYGDGAQAQIWLLRTNYLDKEEELLQRAESFRRSSDDPRLAQIPESSNLLLGMMLKYAPPTDNNDTVGYVLTIIDFMEENASA